MIGLGIDLCEIARIQTAMNKGENFVMRYFTQEERAYLSTRGQVMAQSAAAMFAAKEAFLKALGVGLSGGIAMGDVGIVHDKLGCPSYRLSEKAQRAMEARGAQIAHVSLTHDAGMAAAVCVLD